MTLVLSVVTREYVAQVSDRRLTRLSGEIAEDRANKAVVSCGHFTFAYTGLAEIGPDREPPDQWN